MTIKIQVVDKNVKGRVSFKNTQSFFQLLLKKVPDIQRQLEKNAEYIGEQTKMFIESKLFAAKDDFLASFMAPRTNIEVKSMRGGFTLTISGRTEGEMGPLSKKPDNPGLNLWAVYEYGGSNIDAAQVKYKPGKGGGYRLIMKNGGAGPVRVRKSSKGGYFTSHRHNMVHSFIDSLRGQINVLVQRQLDMLAKEATTDAILDAMKKSKFDAKDIAQVEAQLAREHITMSDLMNQGIVSLANVPTFTSKSGDRAILGRNALGRFTSTPFRVNIGS